MATSWRPLVFRERDMKTVEPLLEVEKAVDAQRDDVVGLKEELPEPRGTSTETYRSYILLFVDCFYSTVPSDPSFKQIVALGHSYLASF
jgi:hypothetical protein